MGVVDSQALPTVTWGASRGLLMIRMLRLRLIGAGISGGLMAVELYVVGQVARYLFFPQLLGAPIVVAAAAAIDFWAAEEAVATHRTVRFVLRTALLMIGAATLAGGVALEIRFRLDAQPPDPGAGGAGMQWAIFASLFYLPQSLLLAVPVVVLLTASLRALLRRYWATLCR
jgi:hypothetical protein